VPETRSVAGRLLPFTVTDRNNRNPRFSFLLRLLFFLEELQNVIQIAHPVAEVKFVPQSKNPSNFDVVILVYLMDLFHLYRLVPRSIRLYGKTFKLCVGKEVEKGFRGPVDCSPILVNMCHSLLGIEKGQDNPYDNIHSQRQPGPFSQGGGCKEYNGYDNLSVVLMCGNET
jgi:hypothetical protein